jgi:hypothetical protein
LALVILSGLPLAALAQFKQGDEKGSRVGDSQTQRWQVGTIISAAGGGCNGITAYIPVPIDWPEQEVKVVEEDVNSSARISYQTVDETVKLMTVKVARLAPGDQAKALVTYEVKRFALRAPEHTDIYQLPDLKKLDPAVRPYLGPSPYIESRNPKIRDLAHEVGTDKEKAWQRVEAIYDWVRDKVEYKNGPLKGAVAALKDGTGDCEELTSLFIAICRAGDIPARTVWIPGHCYPEFYLVDDEGKGHWFPCQVAGTRAFGEMPEFRPILQKGDNFRPPYNRGGDRQRYLAEHLTGNGGQPKVQFVRKLLGQPAAGAN